MLNIGNPYAVSALSGKIREMAREHVILRIRRLIQEAVRTGQFQNEADVMDAAGLSRSYVAERVHALKTKADADMGFTPVIEIARVLGVSLLTLVGQDPPPDIVDIHEGRARAIVAARALRLPDAAIRVVLGEHRSDDPGELYWFRRIEAEAERLRPISAGEPR